MVGSLLGQSRHKNGIQSNSKQGRCCGTTTRRGKKIVYWEAMSTEVSEDNRAKKSFYQLLPKTSPYQHVMILGDSSRIDLDAKGTGGNLVGPFTDEDETTDMG